jgi:hypothetical protein
MEDLVEKLDYWKSTNYKTNISKKNARTTTSNQDLWLSTKAVYAVVALDCASLFYLNANIP